MDLLEREPVLAALGTALGEVAGGHGRVVLISGEAGIGKTTLVERFAELHGHAARVLWGACDALFTPRPLGPLRDIAETLPGPLRTLLDTEVSRPAIFSAVLDALRHEARPTVVVVEDLHWADEATLDLVKFLARRIEQLPALLVLTYRDDELGARHPLRRVLGDLTGGRAIRRVPLSPLSAEAVRTLVADRGVDPVALHQQTGGNPFFVSEVLAAGGRGIPSTVRDAVLARAGRLPASGRTLLEAAAVIGARIEPKLLAEVGQDVDQATEACIGIGMLQAQGDGLTFRHELARQAILETIAPPRLRALHRQVLVALLAWPTSDLARIAHHAEGAEETEAVREFAPQAARHAAGVGAHREAAAQYARALRFTHAVPPVERARLLEAYAEESSILDQLGEAITALQEAVTRWRVAGNALKEGETLAAVAWPLVRSGRNAEAEGASRQAIALLQAQPPSRELGRAYRIQAHLRMLDRDRAQALRWAGKAITLAERFDDAETLAAAHIVVGSATLVAGDVRGRTALERGREIARNAGFDSLVGLAYLNLGSACGEIYRFDLAEPYLRDGIAYAIEMNLEHAHHYMRAWQALIRMYQGRWSEAGEAARAVTEAHDVSAVGRIMALVALGRLRTRRGDPGAAAALDEALELAAQTGTLQRLAPVRTARAEAAWLDGDRERTLVEARAVYDLALRHRHAWHTAELTFWRRCAGERVALPAWAAAPFALQLRGDWRRAAAAWGKLGCPLEHARALEDGDAAAQVQALEVLDRLGARPAADALRKRLRAEGVRRIPRGPRPTTRAHPFGLTSREMEILQAVAAGLSNARIGDRLHISAKTVDHHVSAILTKLDVPTRQEAARVSRQWQTDGQHGEAPPTK